MHIVGRSITIDLGLETAKKLLYSAWRFGAFNLDTSNWFSAPDGDEIPQTMTSSCPNNGIAILLKNLLGFVLVSSASEIVLVRHQSYDVT